MVSPAQAAGVGGLAGDRIWREEEVQQQRQQQRQQQHQQQQQETHAQRDTPVTNRWSQCRLSSSHWFHVQFGLAAVSFSAAATSSNSEYTCWRYF